MAYTDIDDPTAYFQNKIYTGNGQSGHAITFDGNSDMQPDWVWIKSRNATETSRIYDVVRGASKHIASNDNNAESTDTNGLTAFGSDGFTVGSGNPVNNNNKLYASWNWKAGTSFTNDASGTGIGSLDSTGSVNDTAGFSIVSYTGNTTAGATIKHGLSTKPDVIICKARQNSGGAIEWVVYHKGISTPQNNTLTLNSTAAKVDRTIAWNDTAPTSSVFSVGTWVGTNAQVPMIAYVFSEKQGYSKFGSYIGGGSSFPFIYTGFKPAWVMTKISSATGQWGIADIKRGVAPSGEFLFADSNAATNDAPNNFDFTAQGFKPRADYAAMNTSGATYIFMAFASNPFTTSTGVPATAC